MTTNRFSKVEVHVCDAHHETFEHEDSNLQKSLCPLLAVDTVPNALDHVPKSYRRMNRT